jgi:hypothetical protein
MMTVHRENPYPGLRPFRADETHLFFGRDEQRSELLGRLRRSRFLAVVGTSGSGKSSLVRAGLLPGMYGGFMAGSGSQWRIADLRPGSDPIGNLARALDKKGALRDADLGEGELSFTEATLRRSALGLAEAVRRARLTGDSRLLVLVDQFEELFRLMATVDTPEANDDASAFIKLLLEASHQTEVPIYVVLTMRSDFLGDCARFRDLPEAINDGQYLIPRMTRDQRREAIEGPAAVYGASLSPTLVNRLLNDVGDNPDHLPILQHALMRTWDHWKEKDPDSNVVDLKDYEDEEVGGMTKALSRHADSVLAELAQDCDEEEGKTRRHIAEYLFKCLTEKTAGDHEIRRLAKLQEIVDVADANGAEVISVIDTFRQPSNSFLMPPIGEELTPDTYVDISHESLIRNWGTLKRWAEDEARSAQSYQRLAQTAILHREGKEDLLAEQALRAALEWKAEQQPTPAWGNRYDPNFDAAMEFLADSEAKSRQIKEEQARTQTVWATLRVGVLIFLLTVALGAYFYARYQFEIAEQEIQWRTAEIARDARDRAFLSTLYVLHQNKEKELSELSEKIFLDTVYEAMEKKELEAHKFASPVHFEVASKLAQMEQLSPQDELLASLYRALEYGKLDEAKEKLNALEERHPFTSHFAEAQREWMNWGEIQARKARQETRDRELLSTLYASLKNKEKKPSKLEEVVSKEKNKGGRQEETFANSIHFRIAYKMRTSKELSSEEKLLANIYYSIENNQQDAAQIALDELNKEFPDSTHTLLAQSAVQSDKELDDREVLGHLLNIQPSRDIKLLHSFAGKRLTDDELDKDKFGNLVHFQIAEKLWNAGGGTDDELELQELLLARIYRSLALHGIFEGAGSPTNSMESARLNFSVLETEYPYTIHALLADASLKAAEPPLKDFVETAVQWVYEYWVLIVLVVIWPLWLLWEWIRRRLWKDAKIKAKPQLIPRALAALVDVFIAVVLGLFVGSCAGAISAIMAALVTGSYTSSQVETFFLGTIALVFAVTFSAYLLFRDAIKYRFHRSIGKIVFKLRPILATPDDGAVTMKVSAKRNWILVFFPVFLAVAIPLGVDLLELDETVVVVVVIAVVSLFLIAEFILAAIEEGRTLHDRLGGTRVIDLRSEEAMAMAIGSSRQRSSVPAWRRSSR